MTKIAVFARNHEHYLEKAVEVTGYDPDKLVTFRSSKPWTTASDALKSQKLAKIYFSPKGALVMYEATLKEIVLNPRKGDPATDAALENQLPETVDEQLWESEDCSVKTLYSVSTCRKLSRPFQMTTLIKASDGNPISKDYKYAYLPVLELSEVRNSIVSADEIADPEKYIEGASYKVSVNTFERNSKARRVCIEHYGATCMACGLDFQSTYGEIGAGFIHVHHLTPLALIREGYEVDPIADLRPVCPNCHSMIHRENPPLTLDALRKRIEEHRKE